jgi:O-antigen/teichoic acid export membrane protein
MARLLSRQHDRPPDRDLARSTSGPSEADALEHGTVGFDPPGTSSETSKARGAGERAVANTLYRIGGEIVGRLASLALFAWVGRSLGENGLGAFVFAVAYLGFVGVAVELGLDRYLLRAVAQDRAAANHIFFNVISLKLALAIPVFALSVVGLHLVGYSTQIQATVLLLAPGVFFDSVARTQLSFFAAHERNGPPALADAIQRICSAGLGIAALLAGYGVVAVAASYSIGSLIGVLIGFALLHRTIGMPTRAVSRREWRALATISVPFAAQDTFAVLLARMDTLLISLIATQAAVGRYGAAYRLFESTFLITFALTGAFAAMYTTLGPESDPPLSFVFQRSIKLAVVLLIPLAVAFAVLAGPICELIYGAAFASAASPLRVLSPAVPLMGVINLSVALLVSRENPRRIVFLTGVITALNLVLNLILIPLYGDVGAAAAMLATEVVYAVWVMGRAHRMVGEIQWRGMLAGTLAAGATMAAIAMLLQASLLAALTAGAAIYLLVLYAVERLVSPRDVAFAVSMVRRLIPAHRDRSSSP